MKSLRFTFLVLLLWGIALPRLSGQETYKILLINTPSINIDGKRHVVGDCFGENASIEWSSDKQAMKLLHTGTGKQSVVVAKKYKETHSKSLASYFVQSKRLSSSNITTKMGDIASLLIQNKKLSTREGKILNVAELRQALTDTFYLMDSIHIETPLVTDSLHFFFVAYSYQGERINKRILCEEGTFTLTPEIFSIDGNPVTPFETDLQVYYWNRQKEECLLLTEGMHIVPVERHLDEEEE